MVMYLHKFRHATAYCLPCVDNVLHLEFISSSHALYLLMYLLVAIIFEIGEILLDLII